MKSKHSPLQAALLLACTLNALPAMAEHREHGAHEHGTAHLDVVLDGTTLAIDLDTPAANLIGFEHAPQNDRERAALEQAATRLRDAGMVFSVPPAAGCTATKVVLASPLRDLHGDSGDAHADMEASYRFDCTNPAGLDGITVNLFRLFPGTHRLEVQLITPKGQRAAELTADAPRLPF